ncbi:hypothetical protein [Fulvivirga lutea]|uniref:Uncharacterized protein n=1 Tax=Fulvivirga lutea TaxID=2810512 RepID=A0A974WJD1_9BACT|nr:hypothetical protein [Fulvivirga lutea]QSE98287.1 hypothetical protein JR347_04195 [Fulvivirga lutea]
MISLTDFQVLPFDKKCDFITVFADYILYREEAGTKHYLYLMKDYFVEVNYSPAEGKVLGIHAFKNIRLADAYLDHIDISDLYY